MANTEMVRAQLGAGQVIPACPLALNARRKLDERRQRALFRYYLDAGAGGLAVGVHTTQFAIHKPEIGLLRPVLELAAEEIRALSQRDALTPGKGRAGNALASSPSNVRSSKRARAQPPPGESPGKRGRFAALSQGARAPAQTRHWPVQPLLVAGICGPTRQATAEAMLARQLGYQAGLLSLGALREATEDELLTHCRAVAGHIPLFGFYLQPVAGGRLLPYSFWRRFAEIDDVVAIKIATFNRYQTLEVVRAIADAGRDDIALYTGNDDNIVLDLLTPYRFRVGQTTVERRIIGGLLGHWAVWTRSAVELHAECRRITANGAPIPSELLRRAIEVTDCNAAFFDPANGYAGCIPGIHEVLRRQGLLDGIWCLDPAETLSPGQREEIDRVCTAYPQLNDDEFVSQHRDEWLRA
jgi:hypothetical protein